MNSSIRVRRWASLSTLALTLFLLLLGARPAAAVAYVAPTGPTEILSAGSAHTCALTPAGAVDCWGFDGNGQATDQPGPYTQVSAGDLHNCALTPAGAVDCWGYDASGQAADQPGPYTQVSVGFNHNCALTPAGAVDCWGRNDDGQADDQTGPYSQVSAGSQHTCALTPGGAVDCWGRNADGQADDHPGPYTQVSAGGNHTCALTPAGAVDCWGDNSGGAAADQPGPHTLVSAGLAHTCALTPAGAVECWGLNSDGQADDQTGPYGPYRPPTLPEILSAGSSHTCALTPAGAADCWGYNNDGQADDQPGPYTQISAGGSHTCALTPAGAADYWGRNDDGQADDQTGPYTQVSAGNYHTCALTPAGAADCWGRNGNGQAAGQPGPYTQVSAGLYHTCALTPAGAVDCWGDNGNGQATDQPGPYTQVSAGLYHTCALTPVGTVDCWGYNYEGQADDQPGPYSQISAGSLHNCALTSTGAADCWGRNIEGQADDQPGPYSQISAGGYHNCALTSTGAVDCWGNNGNGQATDQPGPYGPYTPVADLTIVKQVSGVLAAYDWSFDFTGDLGPFSLSKADPDATFTGLTPGNVAFSETAAAGFSATIACDNGDSSATGAITVTLASGDDVTCTVTNRAAPAMLVVHKVVSGAAAATRWSFDYSGDLGLFTLDKANPDVTFTGLDAGSYALSELPQAGFVASAACDNGDGSLNGDLNVSLEPGQTVTCTFSNVGADVFVSAGNAGTTGDGLAFGPEDILRYDGTWSLWFDGTATGLMPNGKAAHNINAFWIPDPAQPGVLISFTQNARPVPGIPGKVDGMDLVWWDGASWSLIFDGQDVGLTVLTNEKIDALHVLDDSAAPPALLAAAGGSCLRYLLLSTQGDGQVTGYDNKPLKFDGTDVLGFCQTAEGATTAGKWIRVLNGKAEGLRGQALVNLSASADGQVLYLTTKMAIHVDSAVGGHSMVYRYDFATAEFSGPYWSAPAAGMPQPLDGLQVEGDLPTP